MIDNRTPAMGRGTNGPEQWAGCASSRKKRITARPKDILRSGLGRKDRPALGIQAK